MTVLSIPQWPEQAERLYNMRLPLFYPDGRDMWLLYSLGSEDFIVASFSGEWPVQQRQWLEYGFALYE